MARFYKVQAILSTAAMWILLIPIHSAEPGSTFKKGLLAIEVLCLITTFVFIALAGKEERRDNNKL